MSKYIRKTCDITKRARRRVYTRLVSISLYPQQIEIARQRARELNLSASQVIQILLDIERVEGLVRAELMRRLNATAQPAKEAA